jgi:hypothetical protein
MQLRRQDEQLASGLDDDSANVPARRRDDLDRLALGSQAYFVAQPHELVSLCEPRAMALTVLVNETWNVPRSGGVGIVFCHGRLSRRVHRYFPSRKTKVKVETVVRRPIKLDSSLRRDGVSLLSARDSRTGGQAASAVACRLRMRR